MQYISEMLSIEEQQEEKLRQAEKQAAAMINKSDAEGQKLAKKLLDKTNQEIVKFNKKTEQETAKSIKRIQENKTAKLKKLNKAQKNIKKLTEEIFTSLLKEWS